jgi:hypothetical protein
MTATQAAVPLRIFTPDESLKPRFYVLREVTPTVSLLSFVSLSKHASLFDGSELNIQLYFRRSMDFKFSRVLGAKCKMRNTPIQKVLIELKMFWMHKVLDR